jgi:uncharacterized protein YbjQ (UPF0145 family)
VAVPAHVMPADQLLDVLADQAAGMGADAVIGIRINQLSLPGAAQR